MKGSKAAANKSTNTATKKSTKRSPKKGTNQDSKKLYEIGIAFWSSGALIAAIRLKLFNYLDNGSLTVESVARRLGANRQWVEKLLIACAALGLLVKDHHHYQNSSLASQYLVEGKPYYQGDFITHLGTIWDRFGQLDHTIKTGARKQQEESGSPDPLSSHAWIMASHNIAMSGQAEALARSLDLKGRKHLCDVGSGPGTYAAVLCVQNPQLHATVLDDPEVVPVAKELIGRFNLNDRIEVKPTQLPYGAYGTGYDVVLLSGVLHGFNDATCKKVLRRVFNSLEPGGIVVIQEMLLDDEEAKPLFPALFSLNMTMGSTYTAAQIMAWLYENGFVKAQVQEIPDAFWMDHLIIAQKV